MVGPLRGGPQPEVPVKPGRDGLGLGRTLDPLGPDGPVRPGMDLAHGAQRAGPDQLDHAAGAEFTVSLVSHLGCHLVFLCRGPHEPGLGDRVSQGLLAVDVLPQRHGHQRCRGMMMVRGRDGDGIQPLLLLQHLAIVGIAGGRRVPAAGGGVTLVVLLAVGIVAGHVGHVGATFV